jgi:hypothetical protein
MSFYNLSKTEREQRYKDIQADILRDLQKDGFPVIFAYFSCADTHIRKVAYVSIGKIYKHNGENIRI